MSDFYILDADGRTVKPVDRLEYLEWHDPSKCHVRQTIFATENMVINTVFVGYEEWIHEPPRVFKTTVVGGGDMWDGLEVGSSTWEQAEQQHERILSRVFHHLRIKEN